MLLELLYDRGGELFAAQFLGDFQKTFLFFLRGRFLRIKYFS